MKHLHKDASCRIFQDLVNLFFNMFIFYEINEILDKIFVAHWIFDDVCEIKRVDGTWKFHPTLLLFNIREIWNLSWLFELKRMKSIVWSGICNYFSRCSRVRGCSSVRYEIKNNCRAWMEVFCITQMLDTFPSTLGAAAISKDDLQI